VTAVHQLELPTDETKLPTAVAFASPLNVTATIFGAVMEGTPWLVTVGNGACDEVPEDEPLLELVPLLLPLLLLVPLLVPLLLVPLLLAPPLLDPLSPPDDEEPHATR
jgi:hypothetical protein